MDKSFPQRDPLRKEVILSLYTLLLVSSQEDLYLHTFPLLSLLGARISGAGMGGRDNAALILLLMGGL